MLALDPHARERTRTYSRRWRIQSSEDLRAMLARIDSVAEAAIYLASFKPRGLIVTLPFGLAAEILLRAHGGGRATMAPCSTGWRTDHE